MSMSNLTFMCWNLYFTVLRLENFNPGGKLNRAADEVKRIHLPGHLEQDWVHSANEQWWIRQFWARSRTGNRSITQLHTRYKLDLIWSYILLLSSVVHCPILCLFPFLVHSLPQYMFLYSSKCKSLATVSGVSHNLQDRCINLFSHALLGTIQFNKFCLAHLQFVINSEKVQLLTNV